jgi:hypothetical protein
MNGTFSIALKNQDLNLMKKVKKVIYTTMQQEVGI